MIGENRSKSRKKHIPAELCESLEEAEVFVGAQSAENVYMEKDGTFISIQGSISLEEVYSIIDSLVVDN